MIIDHSVDQKEYILWKYQVLKNFILTEPRFYSRNNSLTIRTISHRELTQFRDIFYVKNRKIIPSIIRDYLKDALVIAIWFMDDGNKVVQGGRLKGYHFNSQSFTYDENRTLSLHLKDLHDIESIVEKNHDGYRLAIWKKESRLRLKELIQPYVIKDMLYKIG